VVVAGDLVSPFDTSLLEFEVSEMRGRRLPGLQGPGPESMAGVHAASAELHADDDCSGDGDFEEREGEACAA